MRAGLLILLLAGCDKIIGLQQPPADAEVDVALPGHDEDGDGVPDDIDNCPGIDNDQREDDDGDGVGNACDPHPNQRDQIIAFYAFAAPERDWQFRNGSWDYDADRLVYRGEDVYEMAYAKAGPRLTPPYVVDIQYHIDRAALNSELSIAAAIGSTPNGLFCTYRRGAPATMVDDELQAYRPGDGRTQTASPRDLGATFRMRAIFETDELTCDLRSDRQSGIAASTSIDMPNGVPYSGPIGIEGKNADARIDYLIVYGP